MSNNTNKITITVNANCVATIELIEKNSLLSRDPKEDMEVLYEKTYNGMCVAPSQLLKFLEPELTGFFLMNLYKEVKQRIKNHDDVYGTNWLEKVDKE